MKREGSALPDSKKRQQRSKRQVIGTVNKGTDKHVCLEQMQIDMDTRLMIEQSRSS